jgi:guanidinobutyrase
MGTRAAPFESFQVADLGDVPLNTYNLRSSIEIIESFYDAVLQNDVKTLSMGGDHTVTLPILRALYRKHGRMALIHVDAHADVNDEMFGEKIAHGTIFRRALEEGLVDGTRMYQIGLRGTGYSAEDFDWTRKRGAKVVQAEECWHRSLEPLMSEARARIGPEIPTYLSFDIDGLDPSVAPGTGTPEIGGLTGIQGIEVIRGAFGLNLVGADLVEVSPPYDPSGNTSLLAANLLFEMLCSFPGCKRRTAKA